MEALVIIGEYKLAESVCTQQGQYRRKCVFFVLELKCFSNESTAGADASVEILKL